MGSGPWSALFKQVDENGNGYISYTEFLQMTRDCLGLPKDNVSESILRAVWKAVAPEGILARGEFIQFMKLGCPKDEEPMSMVDRRRRLGERERAIYEEQNAVVRKQRLEELDQEAKKDERRLRRLEREVAQVRALAQPAALAPPAVAAGQGAAGGAAGGAGAKAGLSLSSVGDASTYPSTAGASLTALVRSDSSSLMTEGGRRMRSEVLLPPSAAAAEASAYSAKGVPASRSLGELPVVPCKQQPRQPAASASTSALVALPKLTK